MRRAVGAVVAILAIVVSASGVAAAPVQPRPGDAIVVGGGGGCTLGFLFTGSDGGSYMSTAGHCLVGTTRTKRTWPKGAGPAVETEQGRIGRIVFVQFEPSPETGDTYDFALVRLDKGVKGSPEIRQYGSPTGLNQEQSSSRAVLRMYGHGTGVSLVSRARQVVAPNTKNKDHVYAHGPLFQGDSGAPVIDEQGQAVGTVLGAGARVGSSDPQNDVAPNIIGRLSPVLRNATSALRVRLRLAEAP